MWTLELPSYSLEIPNDAYMALSQTLIGCSLLSKTLIGCSLLSQTSIGCSLQQAESNFTH